MKCSVFHSINLTSSLHDWVQVNLSLWGYFPFLFAVISVTVELTASYVIQLDICSILLKYCFIFAWHFTVTQSKKACKVSITVIRFYEIYCSILELMRNLHSLIIAAFFRLLFFKILSRLLEINASYDSFYWVRFKYFQIDLPPNANCYVAEQTL